MQPFMLLEVAQTPVSTTQQLCGLSKFLTRLSLSQHPSLYDEDNDSIYLTGSLGGLLCT